MTRILHLPGFVTSIEREGPLVLGMPHIGTLIPPDIGVKLNDLGRAVPDTDWWLDRLYGPIAARFEASIIMAGVSRFVIDVNRDPSGISLYPGQNTTGLCPLTTFDGAPIYHKGAEPDAAEISNRKAAYFQPFHEAMEAALTRTRARHGYAVLHDCHSIRSTCPNLFDGVLPTLNLGTHAGASCAAPIQRAAESVMAASGLAHVSNGRFKGGWITRNYGDPARGIHAVQMEIAQSAYMVEAPPWDWVETRAASLQATLTDLIAAMLNVADSLPRRQPARHAT
jgi:N-formylglutamate deformylase